VIGDYPGHRTYGLRKRMASRRRRTLPRLQRLILAAVRR
jgi:hypothetical protein